jgi:hypothetical protein
MLPVHPATTLTGTPAAPPPAVTQATTVFGDNDGYAATAGAGLRCAAVRRPHRLG